ncbi:MAG TPA: hypothetical protein VM432_08000 [Bdellovibrionales bacterium]|nr:hypothetical protein [Bdellovibrionales bacterium]
MARVAFFTERIDDSIGTFAFDLMSGLADQQHDLRVYTSFNEDDELPQTHPRIQLIRPFRKWSWLELGPLVPLLLEQQPEILHFIQPHDRALEGLTNAMSAIPAMAPFLQKPLVVVSLYDFKERDLDSFKTLLSQADAITVTNPNQVRVVEEHLRKKERRRPGEVTVDVVPLPNPPARSEAGAPLSSNLENFIAQGRLLLVPGDVSDHEDIEDIFAFLKQTLIALKDVRVLVAGGWGKIKPADRSRWMRSFDDPAIGSRILFSGTLGPQEQQACLANARTVLAASLSLESVALARWTRSSLNAGVPLILNRRQLALDPLPWRDRENAFIVEGGPLNWGATIAEALLDDSADRTVRSKLIDFTRMETFDVPSNAMSRIYARLLAKRAH